MKVGSEKEKKKNTRVGGGGGIWRNMDKKAFFTFKCGEEIRVQSGNLHSWGRLKLQNPDKKEECILFTLMIFFSRQNNDKFGSTMMALNSGLNELCLLNESG